MLTTWNLVDEIKLTENPSETRVVCCYNALFGFTNSYAWHERYNLIVDKINNDCTH